MVRDKGVNLGQQKRRRDRHRNKKDTALHQDFRKVKQHACEKQWACLCLWRFLSQDMAKFYALSW